MPEPSFRVGEWCVRPAALEIEGPSGRLALEAKPMEVLVALMERAGETCSREHLLSTVWGDKFVSEEVLTHAIWELRRALGDPAREPRYIQTVPRRGYRLVAAVTPEPSSDCASPAGVTSVPVRGRAIAIGVLVLVALAAWAVTALREAPPRRVLVLPPEILSTGPDGERERGELVALNVEAALLGALASLEGVVAVSPGDAGEDLGEDEALAAVPAEELVTTRLRLAGDAASLLLLRERVVDGRLLVSSGVTLPAGPADGALLAEMVRAELYRAFSEDRLRLGIAPLEVRDEDYRIYLEIRQRLARGELTDLGAELGRTEELLAGSPRFLDGYLLAGELGRSLYSGTHRFADFERASKPLTMARRLAPHDPRPLVASARLELERGEAERASAVLVELARVAPGDVQVPLLEARIALERGRLDEARAVMHEAVRRFPSWQNRYRLAELSLRAGDVPAARSELHAILDPVPDNPWALAKLGELELFYGDLDESAAIFTRLTTGSASRGPDLVNLGTARYLLGDHEGAVAAFEQALAKSPDHPVALLNLAEASFALGRPERTRELCGRLLARPAEGLDAAERMPHAQCAAYLGRMFEAVALAQRTLGEAGDQPEVVYQAAVVFALVGDRASALVNVRVAREYGVPPRWFRIPPFASLVADPEFRRLVDDVPAA